MAQVLILTSWNWSSAFKRCTFIETCSLMGVWSRNTVDGGNETCQDVYYIFSFLAFRHFHHPPCCPHASAPGLRVAVTGGYRDETCKGLDLTISRPMAIQTSNIPMTIRGNALLQTVWYCTDNQVICGPSLLVDELLRLSGAPSIGYLVHTAWNSDISTLSLPVQARDTFMYLQRATRVPCPTVYQSPCVGLYLSSPDTTDSLPDPRVMFIRKPYWYFIHPELLMSKGHGQTFIGLYTILWESKCYAEDSIELKKALGDILHLHVGEQVVSKYLEDYRSGYQVGSLKSFICPSKKGACQSALEYLKMMGTLHKALRWWSCCWS